MLTNFTKNHSRQVVQHWTRDGEAKYRGHTYIFIHDMPVVSCSVHDKKKKFSTIRNSERMIGINQYQLCHKFISRAYAAYRRLISYVNHARQQTAGCIQIKRPKNSAHPSGGQKGKATRKRREYTLFI